MLVSPVTTKQPVDLESDKRIKYKQLYEMVPVANAQMVETVQYSTFSPLQRGWCRQKLRRTRTTSLQPHLMRYPKPVLYHR